MESKVRNRITVLLRQIGHNPTEFVRADMDELAMLVSLEKRNLPTRFVQLVEQMDSAFPSTSSGRAHAHERLSRILAVANEFPEQQVLAETEELLPRFQLAKPDHDRVMELCADMRKIVFSSNVFDEPHKRRLLNRIAGIEYQLSQKKGLFDVVRGGVNDLGETLGKFGKDIKPLTDRMNEVVSIVRRSTKEYDQLPPPDEVKQLPPPSDGE